MEGKEVSYERDKEREGGEGEKKEEEGGKKKEEGEEEFEREERKGRIVWYRVSIIGVVLSSEVFRL